MKKLNSLLFLLFFSTASVRAEESVSVAGSEGGQTLWGLISQGGWAMWPLGGCCLIMLFLIIYCFGETKRNRFVPGDRIDLIADRMRERDIQQANELLQDKTSVLARVLGASLQKVRPEKPDANKEKIEDALMESLEGEENNIGQWVNYLNVVATVSPMIGLLGTVSGMIGAFQTIASGGMGRPELLAGDIGEALITTATGLVIGIPAMIAFFIFRNRLNNGMLITSQTAGLLIDHLAGETTSFVREEKKNPQT